MGEPTSPPKRMTRARAAAKGQAAPTATTTTTAASRSKAAATQKSTTATRTTSVKRKTRSDELEDELANSEADEPHDAMHKPALRTRGKAKRIPPSTPAPEEPLEPQVPEPAAAPVAPRGRGRPRKADSAKVEPPKAEPPKTTRTRTRKTTTTNTNTTDDESADQPPEPAKRVTRKRTTSKAKETAGSITTVVSTNPTPGLKSAVSRPASRAGGVTKKTVTFQEPEKENVLPPANSKAKAKAATESTTGMRAKPVRKTAAAGAARTTRASAKSTTSTTEDKKEKGPLSPKKDNQNIPLSRDLDSDDELAICEKTPLMKPLSKSPVKPPTRAKDPQDDRSGNDQDEKPVELTQPETSTVFGSPVRRPAPSPWKDSMKSPAKRVEGVPSLKLFSKGSNETSQSPEKASTTLQSPAKRPHLPPKSLQPHSGDSSSNHLGSPPKAILFRSPAKRPASPTKMPARPVDNDFGSIFSSKPRSPSKEPAEEKTEQTGEVAQDAVNDVAVDNENDADAEHDEIELESPTQLMFPGRLSAVLPRHADPALKKNPLPALGTPSAQKSPTRLQSTHDTAQTPLDAPEAHPDAMDVDQMEGVEYESPPRATSPTPPQATPSPTKRAMFGLRAKDLEDQYMSESEDELALSNQKTSNSQDESTMTFNACPSTPTPAFASGGPQSAVPSSAAKAASRAIRSVSKGSKHGFTPLAMQLGEWKASSPVKMGFTPQASRATPKAEDDLSLLEPPRPTGEPSPSKGSFFDDEMQARGVPALEDFVAQDLSGPDGEPVFEDIQLTHEDVLLAAEANEMSLLDQLQVEDVLHAQGHDDAMSETSQEYGDENAVPIDPALLGGATGSRNHNVPPFTPVRPTSNRNFHTVSKVPLKPADDSPPVHMQKRSASVSRLPAARPVDGLTRNATVISYSPTKEGKRADANSGSEPPVTPAKSDMWSSMGTPARTPRRDLNTSLLRGAIVFVDVHTSEGADASTVFVELLTQMGARCVKRWDWNPGCDANGDQSRIGITHVVYKDGGKRTMEKVRESNGVVQCVGVNWVLDCERENEWLDEAPYYIDTSLLPRGGKNRRKSMEPKALANMNGTLLVTPMRSNAGPSSGPARECQTVPSNHMSRRDSTVWMRTPTDQNDEDEEGEGEVSAHWDFVDFNATLTPVPKTPAPETIARFAMDVTPQTPGGAADDSDFISDDFPSSDDMAALQTRTCPPKQQQQNLFGNLGAGLLAQDKDQNVMMRLMAARRKSLQFAPKVASPLSKAWK